MRFLHLLSFLTLSISIVSADITQYVNDLPACGLQCIGSVAESICGLTNSTCACTNPAFTAATTLCVSQNCTVIEAFQVANVTSRACGHPVQSRQGRLIGTGGLAVVAFFAVILRLFSRIKYEGRLMIDDWIMVFVALCLVVFCALGIEVSILGVGKNIWDVGTQNIIDALRIYYVAEMFYLVILALTKISILMFYLRIFPSDNFRKICYFVLGWVLLSLLIILGVTIFQCIPINYNWLGWMGDQEPPKCMNVNALTYSSSAINITQDFAVLFLPLPWLLRLQIGWKKKANVLVMFSVGIFICITSIVRLTKIVAFRETTNPTWDYVDTTYWTAIETYVSVIVPSLPAIRIMLAKKFPNMFSMDTQNGSRHTYEQSHQQPFKMTKGTKSAAISTYSERDLEADFFPNTNLKLGDKLKGEVYTDVGSGGRRKSSDVHLVDLPNGIMVDTTTSVEGRLPSSHSSRDMNSVPVYPRTPV